MINILTKQCDFENANLDYRKIHSTVVINNYKYCLFEDQTQGHLMYLSGDQQLYLLHSLQKLRT